MLTSDCGVLQGWQKLYIFVNFSLLLLIIIIEFNSGTQNKVGLDSAAIELIYIRSVKRLYLGSLRTNIEAIALN